MEVAVSINCNRFIFAGAKGSFRCIARFKGSPLKKIEASEAQYAAELDNALKQYAELQEQATEFDPIELYETRQEIRSNHERDATRRIQNAYGDKYDMLRMYDSKRSVANLLNESAEERSLTERLRAKQKEQKQQQQAQRKPKNKSSRQMLLHLRPASEPLS